MTWMEGVSKVDARLCFAAYPQNSRTQAIYDLGISSRYDLGIMSESQNHELDLSSRFNDRQCLEV